MAAPLLVLEIYKIIVCPFLKKKKNHYNYY